MATRGYISIKNEPEQNYSFDNIIVEAYHDGYVIDMIDDILEIPFKLFELNEKGVGKPFVFSSFLKFVEKTSYKNMLEMWISTCPFDSFDSMGLYSVLCLTKPFKYSIIPLGVKRYGHPVTEDYPEICLKSFEGRLDNIEISLGNIDEECIEEVSLQLSEKVEELNEQLNNYKITEHEKGKYIFNIDLMFLDLFHQKYGK